MLAVYMGTGATTVFLILLLSLRGADGQALILVGAVTRVALRVSVRGMVAAYESSITAMSQAARQAAVRSAARGAYNTISSSESVIHSSTASTTPRVLARGVPIIEEGVAASYIKPTAVRAAGSFVGRGGMAARPVAFEPTDTLSVALSRQGGVLVRPGVTAPLEEATRSAAARMLPIEEAGGIPGYGALPWQSSMTNPAARQAAGQSIQLRMPWLHPGTVEAESTLVRYFPMAAESAPARVSPSWLRCEFANVPEFGFPTSIPNNVVKVFKRNVNEALFFPTAHYGVVASPSGLVYEEVSGGQLKYDDVDEIVEWHGPWGVHRQPLAPEFLPPISPKQFGDYVLTNLGSEFGLVTMALDLTVAIGTDFFKFYMDANKKRSCCLPWTLAAGKYCYDYIARSKPIKEFNPSDSAWYNTCEENLDVVLYEDLVDSPFFDDLLHKGYMCQDCFTIEDECLNKFPRTKFVGTGCVGPENHNGMVGYLCSPFCPIVCDDAHFGNGIGGCCTICPMGQYNTGCTGVSIYANANDVDKSDRYFDWGSPGTCAACTVCKDNEYAAWVCGFGNNTVCEPCKYPANSRGVPNSFGEQLLNSKTGYVKEECAYTCNTGYVKNKTGYCVSCPAGKYGVLLTVIDFVNITKILTSSISYEGPTDCFLCGWGTYSDAGASACTACPSGKWSGTGAASCYTLADGTHYLPDGYTKCPAGQYLRFPDLTTCVSCAAGTYSTAVGHVDTVMLMATGLGTYTVRTNTNIYANCGLPDIDSAGGICCLDGYRCSSSVALWPRTVTLRGLVTQGYIGDPNHPAWVNRFYVNNAGKLDAKLTGNYDTNSKVVMDVGVWPGTSYIQVGSYTNWVAEPLWGYGYVGTFVGFRWDALVSRDVVCPVCPRGTYSAAGSSACAPCGGLVCPAGKYIAASCAGPASFAPGEPCATCNVTCPAGQYISSPCATDQDRQCAACDTGCPAGSYQSSDCNGQQNRGCTPCSASCPDGQVKMVECSAKADIVCRTCSCPARSYIVTACTASSDAVCAPCTCDPNHYSVGCGGSSKGGCRSCSACSPGFYRYMECSFDSDTICMACGNCALNYEPFRLEVSPCTRTKDTECGVCKTCDSGYTQWARCDGTRDTVCAPCTKCVAGYQYTLYDCYDAMDTVCMSCSKCPVGKYASTPCSERADTNCSACKTSCPSGQYLTEVCSGALDNYCTACSTAACSSGQFQSKGCSATANRQCSTCSAKCKTGYYLVSACSATSDIQCRTCSTCGVGQYRSAACTSTKNTQCRPCSLCSATQYQETACGATSDTVCKPCAACSSGLAQSGPCTSAGTPCANCTACSCSQYQEKACSGTTPTVCRTRTLCPADTYSNDSCPYFADTVCRPCSSCPSGKYVAQPCNSSADTVCAACSPCYDGVFVVSPCSGEEDTLCGTCLGCPSGYQELSSCTVYANDTACSPCYPCSSGYYNYGACICTQCSVCQSPGVYPGYGWTSGMYKSGGCTGGTDTVCTPRSVCDFANGVAYHVDYFSYTSDNPCAPCQNCTTPGLYYIKRCGWNSGSFNAVCGNCTQCSAGTYQAAACTQDAQTVCAPCGNCSVGYYRAGDCTALTNTVCLPCTYASSEMFMLSNCTAAADARFQTCQACPKGKYASRACNATTDTVCSNCTQCNPVTYYTYNAQGGITNTVYQTYAAVPCGGNQDAVCQRCTFTPPTGTFYTGLCTLEADMQLRNCSQGPCPAGQYLLQTCALSGDNTCVPCTAGCPNGQYVTKECAGSSDVVCSNCYFNGTCGSGQYATLPTPCAQYNTPQCRNCTVSCPDGYYMVGECSAQSDLLCAPCTECANGFYAPFQCTRLGDAVCLPCSVCAAGQYQARACTGLNNTHCVNCTRNCGVGQYVVSNCSGASDLVCGNCTVCDAGYYLILPCTLYEKGRCFPCSTLCPDGQYILRPCSNASDIVCRPCGNTTCPSGRQYRSQGCTLDRDMSCSNCSTSCNAGYYRYAECGGAADQRCVRCSFCKIGEYLISRCNATADTVCRGCSTCLNGTTAVVACNGLADTVCRRCNCSSGLTSFGACNATDDVVCRQCACPLGKYLIKACNASANATCGTCTPCATGYYQTLPCTDVGNTVCEGCTVCGAGQYVSQACGLVSDTVCSDCSVCADGQYTAAECQTNANTLCLACGTCARGYYQASPCSYNAPPTCVACPATCPSGYYLSSAVNCSYTHEYPCLPCTQVGEYQYIESDCNATADTILRDCTLFCPSPTQYISTFCVRRYGYTDIVCSDCTSCRSDQYAYYACYFSYDVECLDCTVCPQGQYLAGTCRGEVVAYEYQEVGSIWWGKEGYANVTVIVEWETRGPGSCFPAPTTTTAKPTTSTTRATTSTALVTTSTARPTTSTTTALVTTSTQLATTSTPQPTTSTPQPTTSAPQPTTSTPQPTTSTPQPTTSTPQPTTSTPQPTTSTPQPTTSTAQPTTSTAEPTTSTAEPTTSTAQPTTSTAEPTTSTAQPTTSTAQPTTSTAQLTTSTAEPTTSTAERTTSTAEPTTSTSQPTTSTTQATTSTTALVTTTPAPVACVPDLSLPVSLRAQGSGGLALAAWTTYNGSSGAAARTLTFRGAPPGASGSVALTIPGSGDSYAGPAWTLPLPAAARVSAILKTPVLYLDGPCRLEASYQVQDASGRLPVRTAGLVVSLYLTRGWGPTVCGAPDPSSGAGTCSVPACSATVLGWFSPAGDVSTVAVVTVEDPLLGASFISSNLAVVLSRIPQYTPSTGAGMTLELPAPAMPRAPGDALTLTLWANTGGYDLKMWGVQLGFDPGALAWTPGSFLVAPDLYGPPVLVTDAPGVLVASAAKLASVQDAAVTSAKLRLATVTFQVLQNAQDGTRNNTFTCQIIGMLNTGGNQYLTDQPAQVLDLYGGRRLAGALVVAAVKPVGIYAYAGASDLVNWALVGGRADLASVAVRAVYGRYGASDAAASATCAAPTTGALLRAFGCASISPVTSSTGGLGTLTVTSGGLTATVTIRVWTLVNATVQALDPTLQRILAPSGCAARLYQRTLASATAVLLSGPDASAPADITPLVALASSNQAVATVSGATVRGVGPGTAYVSIAGATGTVTRLLVTVSDDTVSVVSLGVTALTGVLWGAGPAQPDAAQDQPVYATLRSQPLTPTTTTAALFVTARFSDGASYLVTADDGVRVASADGGVLAVAGATSTAGVWLARRVVSGRASTCGPLALASWNASCGAVLASGAGTLALEFSQPISAVATLSSAYLTSPSDAWAGFPTSAALTVFVVGFADGTYTSYPVDTPGLELSLTQGQGLASVSGLTVSSLGAGAGPVAVAVRLPSVGNVTATVRLQVVATAVASLILACAPRPCPLVRLTAPSDPAASEPFALPSSVSFQATAVLVDGSRAPLDPTDARVAFQLSPDSDPSLWLQQNSLAVAGATNASSVTVRGSFLNLTSPDATLSIVRLRSLQLTLSPSATLRRIHCAGQFQAAGLSVQGALTDGTRADVTAQAALSSSDPSVAAIAQGYRLVGLSPGTTDVLAQFHGAQDTAQAVVSAASIHASSATLQGLPAVFEDAPGATRALSVALAFDDGSQLVLGQQSASWAWVRAGDLLAELALFASSVPAAVAVGATTGVATLLANWHLPVDVSVTLAPCYTLAEVGSSRPTIANLLPGTDGDVDIGTTGDIPILSMQSPNPTLVPVFLRSDGALKAFELLLLVDDAYLGVTSCAAGPGWQGGFSCRTNDPVGTVLLAGADVTSAAAGARIHVASVLVVPRRGGLTAFAGTVIRVASSQGTRGCPACPIVAGAVPFLVSGPAARRLLSAPSQNLLLSALSPSRLLSAPSQNPRPLPRRALLASTAGVYGDVDGDGRFDTADCLLTQEYFLNLRLGSARTVGCPSAGGSACRSSASLTAWQRRQMDQVADPLAPPGAPDYRDFDFMLRVYANNERFVANWTYGPTATGGFYLRVRLLTPQGQPATAQCGLRFILSTRLNTRARFSTAASLTQEGLLVAAAALGDGWHGLESLGPPDATENVTFAFLVETVDALGQSDPDRRFPFYGTALPPYDAYYPRFVEFATIPVVALPRRSVTAPPTTPPPEANLTALSACCNATVTAPNSPARRYIATAYTLANVTVRLSDNRTLAPAWNDSGLAYLYDTRRLALAARPPDAAPTFGVVWAPYAAPVATDLRVLYTRGRVALEARIGLTIVDVRNVTLVPDLPNPAPVLYRLHCTSAFQTASFGVRAYIDAVGYIAGLASEIFLAPTRPRVATARGNLLVPLAPGATDVAVSWWGFTRAFANLTVLNDSVAFVSAHSPDYVFTGQAGEALPLQLSVSELVPGQDAPTAPQPLLLPNPDLVTVVLPPSVRLANASDAIVAVANSLQAEAVAFVFSSCAGERLSITAALLVNLAPGPYDLDVGLEGPVLALQPQDSGALYGHVSLRHLCLARSSHAAKSSHAAGTTAPALTAAWTASSPAPPSRPARWPGPARPCPASRARPPSPSSPVSRTPAPAPGSAARPWRCTPRSAACVPCDPHATPSSQRCAPFACRCLCHAGPTRNPKLFFCRRQRDLPARPPAQLGARRHHGLLRRARPRPAAPVRAGLPAVPGLARLPRVHRRRPGRARPDRGRLRLQHHGGLRDPDPRVARPRRRAARHHARARRDLRAAAPRHALHDRGPLRARPAPAAGRPGRALARPLDGLAPPVRARGLQRVPGPRRAPAGPRRHHALRHGRRAHPHGPPDRPARRAGPGPHGPLAVPRPDLRPGVGPDRLRVAGASGPPALDPGPALQRGRLVRLPVPRARPVREPLRLAVPVHPRARAGPAAGARPRPREHPAGPRRHRPRRQPGRGGVRLPALGGRPAPLPVVLARAGRPDPHLHRPAAGPAPAAPAGLPAAPGGGAGPRLQPLGRGPARHGRGLVRRARGPHRHRRRRELPARLRRPARPVRPVQAPGPARRRGARPAPPPALGPPQPAGQVRPRPAGPSVPVPARLLLLRGGHLPARPAPLRDRAGLLRLHLQRGLHPGPAGPHMRPGVRAGLDLLDRRVPRVHHGLHRHRLRLHAAPALRPKARARART